MRIPAQLLIVLGGAVAGRQATGALWAAADTFGSSAAAAAIRPVVLARIISDRNSSGQQQQRPTHLSAVDENDRRARLERRVVFSDSDSHFHLDANFTQFQTMLRIARHAREIAMAVASRSDRRDDEPMRSAVGALAS